MRHHGQDLKTASLSFCVPLGAICPRCGEPIIAPEESEFAPGRGISHTWVCDSCGHTSRTTVPTATH